jgi:hypothetical protein
MTNEPTASDDPGADGPGPAPEAGDRPDALDADTVTTTVLPVAPDEPPGSGHDAMPPPDQPADPPDNPGAGVPGGFPIVLRGYDRHRVDAVLTDLRADLDAAVARYETAEAALAAARAAVDDAEQRAARAEAAAAQLRQATDAAASAQSGRVAPAQLGERIRRILELAEEEAAQIRATARRDADDEVAALREAAARLHERKAQLTDELGRLQARLASLLQGGGSRPPAAPSQ